MENLTLTDENGKKIKPDDIETDLSIEDKLETVNQIQDSDLTDCLDKDSKSSKLSMLLTMVENSLEDFTEDKLIIVSQWTGVLSIVGNNYIDSIIGFMILN